MAITTVAGSFQPRARYRMGQLFATKAVKIENFPKSPTTALAI